MLGSTAIPTGASPGDAPQDKIPFDIDQALKAVGEAVAPFPKAALFELYEDGYRSVFEQLIACMLSIRTLDEVMLRTARRLFRAARTPEAIAKMDVDALDDLIHDTSFHRNKAEQILTISRRIRDEFGGKAPCDAGVLTSFPGVGPKCANLTLSIACGEARIGVDVHVHRVTNRWGYVRTASPEATMAALEETLPRRYWVEINRLLVPFGKHICTGTLPRCSTCPVHRMCRQVGVARHR